MILKESVMTNRRSEKGWWQNFRVEIPVTESWRSDFRVEIPVTKSWRQNFRTGMSAAHRRFREIKTPAMHIPVKMIKAILITQIKISGDASAREASPMQQVTMIVTITILMV